MMEFRIADTFINSLGRLPSEEQKAVKTTVFDLQMNPARPSLRFERVNESKDKNFWSVRVNLDLRLIVHRSESSLLLCYAGHHDEAYDWANRRKIDVHPKTGAAQLVELRETVQEVFIPKYVEVERATQPGPALFANTTESELLAYGVPPEWLQAVREADRDRLAVVVNHLPEEAGIALLDLAEGKTPTPAPTLAPGGDPFTHPDAQRRFHTMGTADELEQAFNTAWKRFRRPRSVRKPPHPQVRMLSPSGANAVLPVCDWVYFATSSPEDFATTRNLVREFGAIIRTVFNSAGIRIANLKQLQQGDTILLVHGGGRNKAPYLPMFSCKVVAPRRPVPNFDGISLLDESQQERLRDSGYSPDPHLRMFTGISIQISEELEHLTCSIPRPPGINALRRWEEVFGSSES